MTIGSTFTSGDLESEWSLGFPFTSAQLAAAAGLGSAFTSADLVGLSAYTPPTVEVTPTFISGSGTGMGAQQVTTFNSATAMVSNGTAPFSYSWERVSGDLGVGATSGSQITQFTAFVQQSQTLATVMRCRVTDATGTVAFSNTIAVSISNGF